MDPLMELSLEAINWLQTNYPQLETLFLALSNIGRTEFYLAMISLVYWCLNKRLGLIIGYLIVLASTFNSILKHTFRDPRPYWIEPEIGLSEEGSYGLPSGHAQFATVFYFLLAAWLGSGWIWLLALIMVFLMALSRVYLGVHDIPDVFAGILLGTLILIGAYLWRRYASAGFDKRILGQRLLAVTGLAVVFGLIYAMILLIIGQPDYEVPWASFIDTAEVTSLEEAVGALAALLGLGIGFALEGSRVRLKVDGPIWKRALRYLVGIGIALGLWLGLRAVFPDEPLWLTLPLHFLRALLLSLWVAYYAPMVFVRLRLADADPEPELSLTI